MACSLTFGASSLIALLACAGLSTALAEAETVGISEAPRVREADACTSAESMGDTVSRFSLNLAAGNTEGLAQMLDPERARVFVAGPAHLIPRLPLVRPVGERRPWSYRSFSTTKTEELLEFTRQIGSIPYRLKQISLASIGRNGVGFASTGRVTGNEAWKRSLQVLSVGAFSCDGTALSVSVSIGGGNTGIPLKRGWCHGRRTLAVSSKARICARNSSGFKFWTKREAK